MLRARVFSAVVLLPPLLLLIFLGDIPWLAGVLLAGILAWREMCALLQQAHLSPARVVGLLFVVGFVTEAYLRGAGILQADLLRPLLAALTVVTLVLALYDRSDRPAADWTVHVAAPLYIGFLLGHFVTLRQRPEGLWWIILAFGVTWLSDTGAYFVGSTLGRRPLWPRLSAKKTWEGLAGGGAAALASGALLGPWLVGISPPQGLAVGAAVALLAPFGDFSVSLLKRSAGAKDSSNLIPGHGGVLDRLDSLLFTVPAVTYLALLVP